MVGPGKVFHAKGKACVGLQGGSSCVRIHQIVQYD